MEGSLTRRSPADVLSEAQKKRLSGVLTYRVDRVTQFTALEVRARLRVPSGANGEQVRRLLTKAEETCLVTNSLKVRPQGRGQARPLGHGQGLRPAVRGDRAVGQCSLDGLAVDRQLADEAVVDLLPPLAERGLNHTMERLALFRRDDG